MQNKTVNNSVSVKLMEKRKANQYDNEKSI